MASSLAKFVRRFTFARPPPRLHILGIDTDEVADPDDFADVVLC